MIPSFFVRRALACCLPFFLGGCSTAWWYDFLQAETQHRCAQLKTDLDRKRCLAANHDSYVKYQSERQTAGSPPSAAPRAPLPPVSLPFDVPPRP